VIYVLGFRFRAGRNRLDVALIHKRRPTWMEGKFNGIGGKVEMGELPLAAMVREFHEETGVLTTVDEWRQFATIKVRNHVIYCFVSQGNCVMRAMTDEPVDWFDAHLTNLPVMRNLRWLIPMALDPDNVTATING
jgi:8-oxo-dGTP diphosphatase